MSVLIDLDSCTGCGLCEDSCPFEAIEVVDGLAQANEACTLCGACVEACPEEAISLPEKETSGGHDLSRYHGVWVFCEQRRGELHPVGFELLGQGRRLADELEAELVAVLFGHEIKDLTRDLISRGADKVLVADDPLLASFTDDVYGQTLAAMIDQERPEIVLCGATALGRSFFPRVATTVGTGLTADCTELAIDPETKNLLQTRPAFGGNIMATILCPDYRPQMATVRPKVMQPLEADTGRPGEVVEFKLPETIKPLTKVIDSVIETSQAALLTEAEIIVTAGRGIQDPKHLDMIKELAELLGGAVGATRGVVDNEWLPYAHQVGQTGRTVSPKLYIAVGVSGAVQHVVGMQGSQTIVAINSDPNAPIFDVATIGLVGDLFEIVPAMIDRIKSGK